MENTSGWVPRWCLLLLVLLPIGLQAQQTDFYVRGKVIDKNTGEDLIGATILEEGTANGTVANVYGEFQLKVAKPCSLVISYVGYPSQTVWAEPNTRLEIRMEVVPIDIRPIPIPAPKDISVPIPASHRYLLKAHLERDNGTTIAPALNRVTGVYMHSGALNTNRITIRGIGNRSPFSTTKIRAYLDNIPLTSGDGETTIEDIDLSLLKQVNVWKGPSASQFGAGLGGVIHLITPNKGHRPNLLETRQTVGSNGLLRNTTLANLTSKNRNYSLGVAYNNTHSDGYRDNNEYDREGLVLLGRMYAPDNSKTTLLTNLVRLKAFIPSSLNRDDYENNPSQAAFSWGQVQGFEEYDKALVGLSHDRELLQFGNLRMINSTSVFVTYRDAYESRPFNILEENSVGRGVRSALKFWDIRRDYEQPLWEVGVEHYTEDYDWTTRVTNEGVAGDLLSDNEERRRYFNGYLKAFRKFGYRWHAFAGVNVNTTTYDYTDKFLADSLDQSGDYGFDPVVSPNLGVSYQLRNHVSLFGNVSHGFSPPSLEETLTPEGAINPDIQMEQGWNFEAGAKGKWGRNAEFELTAYTMDIRDLLVAERVGPDQFVGANAGRTRHTGVEAYFNYKIIDKARFHCKAWASYTFSNYEFVDFVDEENDYSGNDLTGTPPHQLNVGTDFTSNLGIWGNVTYRFVDAFPMRDDNSISSDAYQVVRLKVGYGKVFRDKLRVFGTVGVDNLFDESYASMILINAGSFGGNAPRYYYPGLPRNYFGQVGVSWFFRNGH